MLPVESLPVQFLESPATEHCHDKQPKYGSELKIARQKKHINQEFLFILSNLPHMIKNQQFVKRHYCISEVMSESFLVKLELKTVIIS